MRFELTNDQIAFRDAARDLLAKECGSDVVRAAWEGEPDAGPWEALEEMGVLTVLASEADGGLALDETFLVPVLEEAGRVALPHPLTATAMVAAPLGVRGHVVATNLGGPLVPWATRADAFLLHYDNSLHLHGRDEVEIHTVDTVDRSRQSGRVAPSGNGELITDDPAETAAAFDRGVLGTAAELIGLTRTMLELTVIYVTERQQFGKPIGSFQAVKHHLADARLQLEFAAPVVTYAAYSTAERFDDSSRAVSMAKSLAGQAATATGRAALQCHGAIGYTVEADLHLYMKRAWALARSWGRSRVSRRSGSRSARGVEMTTSANSSPPQPLAGIRVADFSRVLAGPLVTMTLGDMGADVIKIERPGAGDDTRAWGPPWWEGDATYYLSVNRNKRSIALDLTDESDLALARTIACEADVLVENFRPGLMHRLGLDYDTISADNPALVYCTIAAFGTEGEAASIPGYDLVVQAMSGIMHVSGDPEGPPVKVGVAAVDMTTGLFGTIGVLAALNERAQTGRGRYVEVSLFASALAVLANQSSAAVLTDNDPFRALNRHPSIAPYELFQAGDGELIIAAANDKLFERTCHVLGRPDLVDDPRFGTNTLRRSNVEELVEIMEDELQAASAAEWTERLLVEGVPCGPVNSIKEALAWARELDLDPTVTDQKSGFESVRSPIKFDRQTIERSTRPPSINQHGDEIRSEFD